MWQKPDCAWPRPRHGAALRPCLERIASPRRDAAAIEAPRQIALCGICQKTRKTILAGIMGGASFTREAGKTKTDFLARVTDKAAVAVLLTDKGR